MLLKTILPVSVFAILISCNQIKNKSDENLNTYKLKGDTIVAKTFDSLRNTLIKVSQEKGFAGAVEFCNTNALSLTNTYANENISIKRTSERLRNPANAADPVEQRILAMYKKLKDTKQPLEAVIEKGPEGNYHYFKPIVLLAMCQNCHGEKDIHIQPETWQMIQTKYPKDAAYNYREGDLRGIWHVEFQGSVK